MRDKMILDFCVFGGHEWYKMWKEEGRGGVFAEVSRPDGHQYSGPFGTREEAKEWIAEICAKPTLPRSS